MIRPRREGDLERCVALLCRVYERRGWTRVGTAALALSAEPRRLSVVLFVLR